VASQVAHDLGLVSQRPPEDKVARTKRSSETSNGGSPPAKRHNSDQSISPGTSKSTCPGTDIMLSGQGSGHPRIFVKKVNSIRQNEEELLRRLSRPSPTQPADASVDYVLLCMQEGGPLRRNWQAV